jgi:ferredoxin--NADP+ reductase
MIATLPEDELLGDMVRDQLLYYPTVTREPFRNTGRITGLIENGKLCADLGLPALDPAQDRLMLCGSPGLLGDMGAWFKKNDIHEGSASEPGQYVIEKAFVEK